MSVPLLVRPITGFQPPFRSILYYPHQSVDLKNSPDSKRRFAPARSSRIFGKGLAWRRAGLSQIANIHGRIPQFSGSQKSACASAFLVHYFLPQTPS
jgi:hypothetical protein